MLDPILERYVEDDRSADEIVAEGFDPAVVARVIAMVDRSEYKRRQAPPGIKITPKAFGRDRRLPITNWYRGRRRLSARRPPPREDGGAHPPARHLNALVLRSPGSTSGKGHSARKARGPRVTSPLGVDRRAWSSRLTGRHVKLHLTGLQIAAPPPGQRRTAGVDPDLERRARGSATQRSSSGGGHAEEPRRGCREIPWVRPGTTGLHRGSGRCANRIHAGVVR